MTRRIVTVLVAIVLAILGTAGVLAYVHQADVRAVAGQKAEHVLVATAQIPAGTQAQAALSSGLLKKQILPASSVPSNAIRKITPNLANLVLSTTVAPGELILLPMLVTSTQASGALLIPNGMIAVTLLICLPEDVGGSVQQGSHVAVFDTYSASGALTAQPACNGPHQQQDPGKVHTRLVMPKVLVLSVGPGTGGTSGSTGTTTSTAFSSSTQSTPTVAGEMLVTFAVDQSDAERLIQLTEAGVPYLALLSDSSVTKRDTSVVSLLPPLK